MNTYLNDLLCRKAHSTQHCLFRLIQSWKKELENLRLMGKMLMNFTKVYVCLPRDFLIAKLEVYGLNRPSLNLVNDYLSFQ